MSKRDAMAVLEDMIDKYGLSEVVDMLATICDHKSQTFAHEMQDVGAAKVWDKRACIVMTAFNELLGE